MAVRVLPEDSDTESAEVSDSRIRVNVGIFLESEIPQEGFF